MTDDVAAMRDRWIAEANARGQMIVELRRPLKDIIGLVDLLCSRHDVSPEFKEITKSHWRVTNARNAIERTK